MGVVLLQCVWMFSGKANGFLDAVSLGYLRSLWAMDIQFRALLTSNPDNLIVHLVWQGIAIAAGILLVLRILKKETSGYEAVLWPMLLFVGCGFFVGLYLANYYGTTPWSMMAEKRRPAPPLYLIQPAILCALSAWGMVRRAREIREGEIWTLQRAA